MIENITINEIIDITNGKILNLSPTSFSNFSTDSRYIEENTFFVPLIGENFDGHNFIDLAFEKGATGCFVQKNKSFNITRGKTIIEVENTLEAYQKVANYIRKKINPFVIGITGSSGKTSTKELAYAFFSKFFKTHKTVANFNNEIGVPKTLLEMTEDTKVAIIEMGMRGFGQIEELVKIALPDFGIITGVGTAHIELLGSKEGIAKAKWEIESNCKKLAIPAYDEELMKLASDISSIRLSKINLEKDSDSILYMTKSWFENEKQYFEFFDTLTGKLHTVLLSVAGKHQISNALLVLVVAKELGIEYPDFIDMTFENLAGRSEEILIKDLKIINDSYNANLESMKASIDTFFSMPSEKPKILVLGEMRELGEYANKYHFELGEFCAKFNMKELIVIGLNAKEIKNAFELNSKNQVSFFENNILAGNYIKEKYLSQKLDFLFKASRGAKLEEVINLILSN